MTPSISWDTFLEQTLKHPQNHRCWLQSLSYLEYIGYRKMVKAVPYAQVQKGVFDHLSDEIQHSFLLKEMAEKLFPHLATDLKEEATRATIAENYFQSLDGALGDWTKKKLGGDQPYLCYLLVSWIIEKRAMKVYPSYAQSLPKGPLKKVLQKIIGEEAQHLNYLQKVFLAEGLGEWMLDPLPCQIEEKFFQNYLKEQTSLYAI